MLVLTRSSGAPCASVCPGRRGRGPRISGGQEHHEKMMQNFIMFREMWSLFNLDDTKSLRISDLVQGVTSVCQLDNQEFFDFYPAVRFEKII